MSRFSRIEDIEAWQKARALAGLVYKSTRTGRFAKDFGLRDQIRRSAVSVMANIAEGFGRKTNKDFAQFLYTAKGSAIESVSHLYVALDQGYLDQSQFNDLKTGYDQVIKMLINLIRHLESHPRPSS